MMNPRRFSTVPAPVLRSVALATGIVGLLATGSEGLQSPDAAPRTDISIAVDTSGQIARNLQPDSPQHDSARIDQTGLTTAEPALASAGADITITLNLPKAESEAASTQAPPAENSPPAEKAPPIEKAPSAEKAPPTEDARSAQTALSTEAAPPANAAPVQVANANPSDGEVGIKPVASGKAAGAIDIPADCLAVELCIDRYLWALYERTPKEDAIKQVEWRNVTVMRKGKGKKAKSRMVTVSKAFTKLVDQDFTWKDPKAAERARLPMMEYVIGGMDRSFKVKLFQMLRAAETAGLSPGITSGFRDDYRQSIASGLKAASNRSYHGGSLRGGYGHGLAADIVSIQGETRNQRFASSARLWSWVDAHGKEFGIGRPYLGRDPPHVAPVDGQEYAKHNRGTRQAAADLRKKADAKNAEVKTADARKTDVKKTDVKTADVKNTRLTTADARKVAAKKVRHVVKRNKPRLAKRPSTAVAQR